MMKKTYDELMTLPILLDRFNYLKLNDYVGEIKHGALYGIIHELYTSAKWRAFRRKVLIRDDGLELGMNGYDISGPITVHHIQPITIDMWEQNDPLIFDMNNVISCSDSMHKAIHYGNIEMLKLKYTERTPGDTTLW